MREYARQRGLRRWLLPVPVLTPWLSSLWLGLVTPLYARIGRKLIDSVRHPTVVRDTAARRVFAVVPSDIRTAMARALENEGRESAETRWSDALSVSGAAPSAFGGTRIGRRRVGSRALRAATVGMALTWLMASQASAAEIEGVHFVERHQATGALLRLQGVGLLRYRMVFKGYVAALYLGEHVAPERALEDVPRRLEIAYFWSIPASALAQATRDALAWNTGPEALALLRDRIERFNALYEDVAPDDRYALTYVPGRGTELALNGEPLGVIEGADFSAALFAIWLGEKPLDAALRAQLLADR
jgi:hypothetical protein